MRYFIAATLGLSLGLSLLEGCASMGPEAYEKKTNSAMESFRPRFMQCVSAAGAPAKAQPKNMKKGGQSVQPVHYSLTGKVTLKFSIGPGGEAYDISFADDTLHQPKVNDCLVHFLKRIDFTTPPGGHGPDISFVLEWK